jgi:hypothetical protein
MKRRHSGAKSGADSAEGEAAPGFRFAHPGYRSRPQTRFTPAKSVKHFFSYNAKYFL